MFVERLVVPWWWSAIAMALAATFVLAVWAILGDGWGLGALVVALGLTGWGLWQWSRASIRVDDGHLQAAGASIEGQWIDRAEVLDAAETSLAVARAARQGDHLVLRPWLRDSVRVWLADPDDPHPSWLLQSRRVEELAEAVNRLAHEQAAD